MHWLISLFTGWTRANRERGKEARLCREGIADCAICRDMKVKGLNPYTGEPLSGRPGASEYGTQPPLVTR